MLCFGEVCAYQILLSHQPLVCLKQACAVGGRILRLINRNRLQPSEMFDRGVTTEDYDVDRQHRNRARFIHFPSYPSYVATDCPNTNVRLEWLLQPLHLRRRQINADPFEQVVFFLLYIVTGLRQIHSFQTGAIIVILFEGSSTQMRMRRRVIDVIGDI